MDNPFRDIGRLAGQVERDVAKFERAANDAGKLQAAVREAEARTKAKQSR